MLKRQQDGCRWAVHETRGAPPWSVAGANEGLERHVRDWTVGDDEHLRLLRRRKRSYQLRKCPPCRGLPCKSAVLGGKCPLEKLDHCGQGIGGAEPRGVNGILSDPPPVHIALAPEEHEQRPVRGEQSRS